MKCAAIGIAVAMLVVPAQASEVFTVRNLVRACQAPEEDPVRLYCTGLLAGVAVTMQLNGELAGEKKIGAEVALCFGPEGTPTRTELARTFLHWAVEHPENADELDVIGAIVAFQTAYGCKQ